MKPLFGLLAAGLCAIAQVTTAQYDNSRSGTTLVEKILTPAVVSSPRFGKLFSMEVDGAVYAQPLYLPGIEIAGKGRHDAVFLATEHDSVYAFDASRPGPPLWHASFVDPARGITTLDPNDVHCPLISPEIGISSTPVIDAAAFTLYVLARTKERGHFRQRLHALDVRSGAEKPGSPVEIRASFGGVRFDPQVENQRAALLLSQGRVYITWCGACDSGAYHGWVMAYDARTLKPAGVLNTSAGSMLAGIWQSDAGPAADSDGNVYLITGNGAFDPSRGDFGNSVLKLRLDAGGLRVADYFTPFNQVALNDMDLDLGSQGPVLLEPHLLVFGTKGRGGYLIDRENLGRFRPNNDDHAEQTLDALGHCFGAAAHWSSRVYFWCGGDVLREYRLAAGKLSPAGRGTMRMAFPGATPAISADGGKNGIVWAIDAPSWQVSRPAILRAFDAEDLARELYNSAARESDRAGPGIRFAMPTIAAGRVYLARVDGVDVYGLQPAQAGGQPRPTVRRLAGSRTPRPDSGRPRDRR